MGDDLVDFVRGVEAVGDKLSGDDTLVEDGFDVAVTVVGNYRLRVNAEGVLEMIESLPRNGR